MSPIHQHCARFSPKSQKESVCVALFETCGSCPSNYVNRAIRVIQTVRPSDLRLLRHLHIFEHIASGNLPLADAELQKIRDESDAVWWQTEAQIAERVGDESRAHVAWERASELLPHPDVVRRSVRAAFDRRTYESAVRRLKALVERSPRSEKDVRALIWAHVQLREYGEAAKWLERLVEEQPATDEYRLGLAQCLAHSNQPTKAIPVLKPLCNRDSPPLAAAVLQSQLLQAHGLPQDAFALLERIRHEHWANPQFLVLYMNSAHAAQQDLLASEALIRLTELRREGKVPSQLMQEGTLEQLLEHGREYQRRRSMLQEKVVAGRIPWLLAEHVLGNPPTWSLTLHTQELSWLAEDNLSRAAYTVYATNGYTVQALRGVRSIQRIEAAPAATPVIADLSALLTLHRLGHLERAADFFGKLLLPSRFGELRLRDAGRFGQHQPSRETELRRIRDAIDRGRIIVVDEFDSNWLFLSEYSNEKSRHPYRLQDLLSPLLSAQKLEQAAIDELRSVAHKPCAVDDAHDPLSLGARILFDLSSLRTIAGQSAFEGILETFSVHLCRADLDQLVAELRGHETARAAKDAHDSLWDNVNRLIENDKAE